MTALNLATHLPSSRTSAQDVVSARVLLVGPIAALATIVLAALTGATAPSSELPTWVPWVALAALAVGVPHGAVDHLALIRPVGRRWLTVAKYLALYVAVAAAATTLILLVPEVAFGAVIAMSVWHFGTGDMESLVDLGGDVRDTRGWSALHAVAAGAVPIVLPLTGGATAATLGLIQPRLPSLDGSESSLLRLATLALAFLVITRLVSKNRRRAAIELTVLVVLGLVVTPLLAFGVYFAFWHALRHTARLAQNGAGELDTRSLWFVFAAGLPALALTLTFVAVALLVFGGLGDPGPWLWTTLALVWGLTVPHMAVVSRFDAARRSES